MGKPLIINVQRYSIHDGDGIRTTVFFKGCPLSCNWCHNVESNSFKRELMFYEERCVGCGSCVPACPEGAIHIIDGKAVTDRSRCTACGICETLCIYSARAVVGKEMKARELADLLMRDYQFYETSGGGVTLSGGEVMAQDPKYILELMEKLNDYGCSVNIDTCGDVPYDRFESILTYTDVFLYDIKAITPKIHLEYTGKSNERIIENLKKLNKSGAKLNIRIPVIPDVNDGEEMGRIISFVRENISPIKINLLPYHRVGKDKASRLGKGMIYEFREPSGEEMKSIQKKWLDEGISKVEIGG
ncbi:MAG TPA: glycyl-radical enzyme activating protein [Clostridia bacterium]|nr:glycyl-radical enzyme activating protein [Clostridia bacterium]